MKNDIYEYVSLIFWYAFSVLFIFNVVMTVRLYRDMVENIKTEEV